MGWTSGLPPLAHYFSVHVYCSRAPVIELCERNVNVVTRQRINLRKEARYFVYQ
jgi:hypothetical protein